MSYSTIYSIKFSKGCEEIAELPNGNGSAPVVWDALAQKYLGCRPFGYYDAGDRLWKLVDDKTIPEYQRAVLAMTFDYAYLKKSNFKRAAEDIRKFLADFTRDPKYVNHWPKIAEIIESSNENNIDSALFSLRESLHARNTGTKEGGLLRSLRRCRWEAVTTHEQKQR